jgi:lysocardiolipin and lysophospholipid acyltransferase
MSMLTIRRQIAGILMPIATLWTAFLAYTFWVIPVEIIVIGIFRSTYWGGVLIDQIVTVWTRVPIFVLEIIGGVQVQVSGDLFQKHERVLIVSNHRCRFDWLFTFSYIARYGDPSSLKIVLKHGISKLPYLGWCMQAVLLLFLKRKWEVDQHHMTRVLNHYNYCDGPLYVLLYAEGTDLSPDNKTRSHQFSDKRGLVKYDYVLHPRPTGFIHCIKHLRRSFDAVYDLSVAYTGLITQNESDLLKGHLPTTAVFHMQRTPMANFALMDDAALEKWLRDTFAKKESELEQFYTTGKLPTSDRDRDGDSDSHDAMEHLVCWVLMVCWAIASYVWYAVLLQYSSVWILMGVCSVYGFIGEKIGLPTLTEWRLGMWERQTGHDHHANHGSKKMR